MPTVTRKLATSKKATASSKKKYLRRGTSSLKTTKDASISGKQHQRRRWGTTNEVINQINFTIYRDVQPTILPPKKPVLSIVDEQKEAKEIRRNRNITLLMLIQDMGLERVKSISSEAGDMTFLNGLDDDTDLSKVMEQLELKK